MSDQRIFIPFRDTRDMHLRANLDLVMGWWYTHGFEPTLVSDDLPDGAPFNRFRAMNQAVEKYPDTEVLVFCDADTILAPEAVHTAVSVAGESPLLFIPFLERVNLSAETTEYLRDFYGDGSGETLADWWSLPANDPRSVFAMTPESRLEAGEDVGSAYILSRETLASLGGFPETVRGYAYAHSIFFEGAVAVLSDVGAGFLPGPALRLWHPHHWLGENRTEEDKEADAKDRSTLIELRADMRMQGCAPVHDLFSRRISANR